MKRILTFISLLLTFVNYAQLNQIDTRKAVIRSTIIYQGDTLGLWEDSLGVMYSRNDSNIYFTNDYIQAPNLKVPAGKFNKIMAYNSNGYMFPQPMSSFYDTLMTYATDSGSVYLQWERDTTNGYIFPASLTDKVGIGVNDPSEALEVNGKAIIGNGDAVSEQDAEYVLTILSHYNPAIYFDNIEDPGHNAVIEWNVTNDELYIYSRDASDTSIYNQDVHGTFIMENKSETTSVLLQLRNKSDTVIFRSDTTGLIINIHGIANYYFTEDGLKVDGTARIGNGDAVSDAVPEVVLTVNSHYYPALKLEDTDDPTTFTQMSWNSAEHEFYNLVTDANDTSIYTQDAHGSFIFENMDDEASVSLTMRNEADTALMVVDTNGYRIQLGSTKHYFTSDEVTVDGGLQINKTAYYDAVPANSVSAEAVTIDWTDGNIQSLALSDTCTVTFTAPSGPCHLTLIVNHANNTTVYPVTWPAGMKWPAATPPTMTAQAEAIDIISFLYDGTSYYGMYGNDFEAIP